MIVVERGLYTIKTNAAAPGTFKVARTSGKGAMPLALLGAYTSIGEASRDIDAYMKRTARGRDASEATSTRRGK